MPRDTMPQPRDYVRSTPVETWYRYFIDMRRRRDFWRLIVVGSNTLSFMFGAGGMYLWLS